jgi:hypothetical protein
VVRRNFRYQFPLRRNTETQGACKCGNCV